MTKLHPDKILQRVNGINIEIVSVQKLKISLNQQEMICTNYCLLILEAFAQPVSVRQGLQKLNSTSAYEWINLTDALNELYNFGALRDPAEIEFAQPSHFWGFDSSPAHIAMLNDRNRTQKFIEAIRETVREGDVVVEIGTGSGVLAIAAARAGAARVYTIEAGAMARTAQKIIGETEVAEKIRLILGWSHQIEIPEKADVLIGEIIGNDPFCESILLAFDDARRRMLKTGARIIPRRLKVFGVPVELAPASLKNKALTSENIENWKNWYGIDFSHLADNINYNDDVFLSLKAERAKELNVLGEAFPILEVDFNTFREAVIQKTVTSKLSKAGFLNGLLVYFDLEPGSQTITTNPDLTADDSSWINPIWYLSGAKQIKDGDSFTIRFSYHGGRHSRISLCE
jgi:predicted RNA methylase